MKKYFIKFLILVPVLFLCNTPAHAAEVCAAPATGAVIIQCVDWGTVTSTDNSITISGAHLTPFVPSGPKTFSIEWGTGVAGQPNGTYSYINSTQPATLNPPYTFNITIPSLQPVTSYYFTISEAGIFDPLSGESPIYTNLFTYGFDITDGVSNPDIDLVYSNNNTNVNVNGNLFLGTGQALMGEQIVLQLYQVPPGTTLDQNPPPNGLVTSPILTTAGSGGPNGSGYFQYTFTNVIPGSAYYLMIKRNIDQPYLITPIYFEVPLVVGNPPPQNATSTPPMIYSGLIPCGFTGAPPCDFDMLIVLINRVVDFLLFVIAFPVVAVVVAWAGVKLLLSGGNSGAKEQAKSMMSHVIVGLILALLAWGIIKLILTTLGYHGPLLSIFGIS